MEQCTRQVRQTRPTVQKVKRHLDGLNDGIELVNIYEAELTDAAVAQVIAAANLRDRQAAQLREVGALDTDLQAACTRLEVSLAGERPWRDIAILEPDLAKIREAYTVERERRLARQEQLAEQARARVKTRAGFAILSADQSHKVLRPLALAMTSATAEAVAPTLAAVGAPFVTALQ